MNPDIVVAITIAVTADGKVNVNCQAPSPYSAYAAIGAALQSISAEYQKQAAQSIQLAPPGFMPN